MMTGFVGSEKRAGRHGRPAGAASEAPGLSWALPGRLPDSLTPMLPATAAEPFDSPSHFYEVLWDGVRCVAFVERGETRLQDRYRRDVTCRYPELQTIGGRLHGSGIVLDGEIVALDGAGRPDFAALRQRLAVDDPREAERLAARVPVTFQAFDILYREGLSLMGEPLRRRKAVLRQAVRMYGPLAVPDHVEREGVAIFEAARQHGLEGIIAKERDSFYQPGERSSTWKMTKVYERDEFVIAGFTFGGAIRNPAARRPQGPFATLLLGYYESSGAFRFAGEVSGPSGTEVVELRRRLDVLSAADCPFAEPPHLGRLVFWCRPELVATIRFSEWTADGRLRFPLFEAVREDVPPWACSPDPSARG